MQRASFWRQAPSTLIAPRNDKRGTLAELGALIKRFGVELIAIGNGTASRETDALVAELLSDIEGKKPTKVVVSEAAVHRFIRRPNLLLASFPIWMYRCGELCLSPAVCRTRLPNW